jgi:hypothetical protein
VTRRTSVLFLLGLSLAGCASSGTGELVPCLPAGATSCSAPDEIRTREYTSQGEGDELLWRREGLGWRLVASKPASP